MCDVICILVCSPVSCATDFAASLDSFKKDSVHQKSRIWGVCVESECVCVERKGDGAGLCVGHTERMCVCM